MQLPRFLIDSNHLYFEGDFIFKTVGDAWRKLQKLLKQIRAKTIYVDLEKIQRLDSAGLALLLAVFRAVTHQGKSLHFVHIPVKMRALAQVSGVADILFK